MKSEADADVRRVLRAKIQGDAVMHEPPKHVIDFAVEVSGYSPCQSKRGCVIFNERGDFISHGHNRKPIGFDCDGSDTCKSNCRAEAVHAEQMALLCASARAAGAQMIHAKTVNGQLVPSGGPSCVQCSKLGLYAGVAGIWLYESSGWKFYEASEWHRLSLEATTLEAVLPLLDTPPEDNPFDGLTPEEAIAGIQRMVDHNNALLDTPPTTLSDPDVLFRVWDRERQCWTGDEGRDLQDYALDEFKDAKLVYCDMEGWSIADCGELYLHDECGNSVCADTARYEVRWNPEYLAAMNHASTLRWRERATKAEAEVLALREQQGWQPIETAPQDGTRVLAIAVADIRNDKPHMSIARKSSRGRWLTEPGAWAIYPSHWMPLPAPPDSAAITRLTGREK